MLWVLRLLSGVLRDYLMFGSAISILTPHTCRNGIKPDVSTDTAEAFLAEAFLAQAPGPHKSSHFCITPEPGEGLDKWGCQHKSNGEASEDLSGKLKTGNI